MSKVTVTKKDVIWSYVAQFFNIGSGLITLPLILHMLSVEEIGMNYLMITISTLVGLLDFGFAPQFARNITYVFAGAHELRREGVAEAHEDINYELLSNMIGVAKMVYSRLAIFSLIMMLTIGSWYIYNVTSGFTSVNNSLIIWVLYSISIYFNIYFFYYSSLLTGKGLVMEAKKAMIAQKGTYILLTFILLMSGLGLVGVVISNVLSPFVGRIISHKYFYSKEMVKELTYVKKSRDKQIELFKTIWYNAKKLGLVFLGSYAINKFSMFIAGLYLTLDNIASYGLMIQLFSIISSTAMTYFFASQPLFAAYRTEQKQDQLIERFALSMSVFYILFLLGSIILLSIGPLLLNIIGSNVQLPEIKILIIYALIVLLENNHSSFATFIVSGNKIPFVESSLIAGAAICLFSFISLKYTTFGILGLVLVQGLCQIIYANWKWPYVVCRQFRISPIRFLFRGINQIIQKISTLCAR